MKIAHVITRLIVGGAQENTIFTVEGLIAKGYKVDLISGPTKGPEGSLEKEVIKKKIPLIIVRDLIREINPFYDIIAFFKLFFIFRKNKYDIVHTHSAKAGILGRISAKLANPKSLVIHTIHGLPFHPYQNKLLNYIYIFAEKIAYFFTDHFICVGQVMKEKSLKAGIGKESDYTVIYSGFKIEPYIESIEKRDILRKKYGIDKDEKVIGMIGRLFYLKGQNYLIEAFKEISKKFPKTKLMFVGDGILKQELEDYAKKNNIEQKVIFTGLVPPEKIPEYVGIMDILVHTSLREGLPRAVAQGLAGGKPVVAFDVDGAKEIVINGETGFIVPPENVKLLKERIIYLLENSVISDKMGKKGQELIKRLFPVEKMVDEIEKIYVKFLNNGKRKRLYYC
ncbi:MAG: glycosyltransferase family 4 protein [Candidatus Omnitrophica bacterium]|nr:glycosyltransferase family 4 protein [Candidatus Omnitrophota bacterium]MCM8802924.1 glycosyltransferase family 4 protein [Candidatus Omnitrophota bacterium]